MIGKKLEHYEITSQIGKGGMGEVYQAKDTKLGRDVAIKVLPEEFALDKDRVTRFQREAKLLASLNHPNIAAIYGLEESEGTHFLVLELIEGQTLSDRIKSGPIPVEEALKLALQMAEALEAAHEKGVIHRDLKPANIKVTPDGKVKILDFGLAKAFVGDAEKMKPLDSPTLSAAATQQGVILGTAAYMSPEQARGKPVDRRADIWAFGVVLYEMLTGKTAFSGGDQADMLAAVIRSEPEWKSLPTNLHWRLKEVLERCLEKKAKDRYGSISDARVDIQKALADPSGIFTQPISTIEPRRNLRSALALIAATVILTAFIVGAVVWSLRAPEPPRLTSFYYELPEDQQFNTPIAPDLAVSPDGSQFVYVSNRGLYLRSIGELDARLIAGTDDEDIVSPFFSPDGKWIAYFSRADNQLKKIPVVGGSPIPLCDANPNMGRGSWSGEEIVFSSASTPGIMQISDNGGTAKLLFEKEGAMALVAPQMLPDGKSVLFTNLESTENISISVKSLETGEVKEITPGIRARYVPTGHLVYSNTEELETLSGDLFAVPFDVDRLEATGEPFLMIENVSGIGGISYAVSDSGTLAYVPGIGSGRINILGRTLVWVDREGKAKELTAPPRVYTYLKISPDEKQVALVISDLENLNQEIFIWDEVRKTLNKRTYDKSTKFFPIWTPDGGRIVYYSNHESPINGGVYWRPANGTGEAEKLASDPDRGLHPYSFSSDGKYLLMNEVVTQANVDISILSMEDDRKRIPLLQTEFVEAQPIVSPDEQYIAYVSDETGQQEIYVRPFPDVDKGIWQVSQDGGTCPLWSPDGRELFYLSLDNSVMALEVETKPTFNHGTPKILFQSKYIGFTVGSGPPWDIHPDGKRFLMMQEPGRDIGAGTTDSSRKINIVLNWDQELKQRVPVD